MSSLNEPTSRPPERGGRQQSDLEILNELRKVQFDASSPEWQQLSEALWEYGYAVLVAWGVSGSLYPQAATKGVRGLAKLPKGLRLSWEDADSLAKEVMLVAVETFRAKSLPSWKPSGGASLKTFFIGRCLMDLPDVYQRWQTQERAAALTDLQVVNDGRFGDDPAEEVEARVLVEELFEDDPVLRRAFELQQDGYSLQEIAKDLEMTLPSLRTSMSRFRAAYRRKVLG